MDRGNQGGTTAHLDTLRSLKRTTPLAHALTASADIGPRGGEIDIPGAGGHVVFPPGAVWFTTHVTMTARAGADVAYDFQPHMTFFVPVFVVQDLRGTTADGDLALQSSLVGAWFDGDLDGNYTDAWHEHVQVREILQAHLDRARTQLSFGVYHFSGYLASSGRAGVDVTDVQR